MAKKTLKAPSLDMGEQPAVLVVDDDPGVLESLKGILGAAGYLAATAESFHGALARLQELDYDVVLTDMLMPEGGGMEMVQFLHLHYPETPVIVFTGFASYQDAVAAVKLGAFDYLTKPLESAALFQAIERALEYKRLCRFQHHLEVIFQGAETLGQQALEMVLTGREAQILGALRTKLRRQEDLRQGGTDILEAARDLMGVTHSSIYLFDAAQGQFSGLAAQGRESEVRAAHQVPISEGVMSYVAKHRRPLLVPDLSRDARFAWPHRSRYRTDSFMIVPLTGSRFWGLINLADRADKTPFVPRDLFLGWLLGRALVEILEERQKAATLGELPSLDSLVKGEVPVGMALLDQNLMVVQHNPAMVKLTGCNKSSLVGQKVFPYLDLTIRDQKRLKEAFQKMLGTQKPREFFSLQTRPRQHAVRLLWVRMSPWPPDEQGSRGLLLVEDVTELEDLKKRLQLYEHLAVTGKLSVYLAHELNHPLEAVRRRLSLAMLSKETPEAVGSHLMEAQKELQKMSLSLKSLMFSGDFRAARSQRPRDLFTLVQKAHDTMAPLAGQQQVDLSLSLPPEFQDLEMPAELYFAFINIIKSAFQVIPPGSQLKVGGALHQDRVEIAFEDSGPGLSQEEMDQVLQPLHTTEGMAYGPGLGLTISRKILERFGGRLVVESKLGQGTRVRIFLPQGEEMWDE